jgi:hypothetical protein
MKLRTGAGRLSSTRSRLSASWDADVDAIEQEIWRMTDEHPLSSDCTVAYFEIATDQKLHVNVTHQRQTREIRGWAGPARTADGFVHNRTFAAMPPPQIVRRVREMIFADPI